MASFTLDGETSEYLRPGSAPPPEACHSWPYGQYPKVLAALPLANGGTVGSRVVAVVASAPARSHASSACWSPGVTGTTAATWTDCPGGTRSPGSFQPQSTSTPDIEAWFMVAAAPSQVTAGHASPSARPGITSRKSPDNGAFCAAYSIVSRIWPDDGS